MAKVERVSPMNSSIESVIASPTFLNSSSSFKFLTPGIANFRRSCSPLNLNYSKSPNLSPIKPKTPRSASPFELKKRDLTNYHKSLIKKQKHGFMNNAQNINEITLSVKVILEELKLTEYMHLFEEEEIFLDVFFTISDDDLKAIGIENKEHRKKLIDFINFNTPKKNIAVKKNTMYHSTTQQCFEVLTTTDNLTKTCKKMISRVSSFFRAHPMLKGMAVYAFIWPTSASIQQLINKEEFDWKKCFRFFLFGTFFVAPSLYGWVHLSSNMWSEMTLKTGITKAVVEQFSYGPAASVSFFTIMTLLEGRSFSEAKMEVREKFPQTFQVGVCFWPFFQIINFTFIKERNRVPFVAFGSFIWTIFLAYMKTLDTQKLHEVHVQEHEHPTHTFFEKLKINLQIGTE
ncbi:hypothetical protein PVAND_013239 [Polypedilum vanderplanki]|uniref:SAM domain-containing protein n=1 Tax=Polypedilum vanderplanki TaxID=319348 RepID=A0A9J6CPV4_POLVA|nr:hypothetical protein PVAND_013239 [Polypedilum vanderplanki]